MKTNKIKFRVYDNNDKIVLRSSASASECLTEYDKQETILNIVIETLELEVNNANDFYDGGYTIEYYDEYFKEWTSL